MCNSDIFMAALESNDNIHSLHSVHTQLGDEFR